MANRLILMPTSGPDAPPVEAGRGSGEALLSGEYLTRTWETVETVRKHYVILRPGS